MGSGKETVLLLPPYLCCWGRVCSPLAPTFKLTFGQPSSRALSCSFRACVPPNTSLLVSVPSFPIPRRIRTPHALHAFTAPVFSMRPLKVPALSFPSQFLQRPWPRCLLKGLGYLGPLARDTERQQQLQYRRSSANVLSWPLKTVYEGAAPWPLPSQRVAPSPGLFSCGDECYRCPAWSDLFLKQILLEVTTVTDSRKSPWNGGSGLTGLLASTSQKKRFIGMRVGWLQGW